MSTTTRIPEVLSRDRWQALEAGHHRAVDELTGDHLDRRRRGEAHPVLDFLFTYYRHSVGRIRRWHPGPGLVLEGASSTERAGWAGYAETSVAGHRGLAVEPGPRDDRARRKLLAQRSVVAGARGRPPALGCFGLHEWAMLYRASPEQVRHSSVPLRLPQAEIDRVVERSRLRCTHMDAFRFFTPEAAPRNDLPLTRDGQADVEQPGCIHAGMDLYRYAVELGPLCPGELLVDCLRAAVRAREVDMRASPYDLSAWGLAPIAVDTAAGRAEYTAFQRRWAQTSNALRDRLLDVYTRAGIG